MVSTKLAPFTDTSSLTRLLAGHFSNEEKLRNYARSADTGYNEINKNFLFGILWVDDFIDKYM